MTETTEAMIEERLRTRSVFLSSANWFYWIAALSVLNTVLVLFATDWMMLVGLGVTYVGAWFFSEMGVLGVLLTIGSTAFVAAFFALLGYFARQRKTWAFVLGIVLYAADGLIFLVFQDWLSLAFHVYVIYSIWRGFRLIKQVEDPEVLPEIAALQPAVHEASL